MKALTKRISVLVLAVVAFCLFLVGAKTVTTPVNAQAETVSFITMDTKVSVRLPDEEQGILTGMRYFINVNEAEFATFKADYEDCTLSFGAALIPTAMLDGKELEADVDYNGDKDGNGTVIINLVNKITKDGISTYHAVLRNIPSDKYETEVSARAFVKIEKEGQPTQYKYTEVTAESSIAKVMTAFYNSGEADEEETVILYDLLTGNLGTISLDKGVYEVKTGETALAEIFGNKYGFKLDDEFLSASATVSSDNTDVATVNGETITGVADGVATLTLSIGSVTEKATIKVNSNYMMTFENESILDSVSHYYTNENFKSSTTAEYLDEYEGEYGVLKVTGISNYNANGPISFGFGITLPEAYKQSGYTLKYRVEKIQDENGTERPGVRYISVDDGFRYNNDTSAWLPSNVSWQTTNADKYGQWITQYCVPSGDTTKDKLGFVVSTVGAVDDVYGGWAIYIAFVMDGDQTTAIAETEKAVAIKDITNSLKGDELATFDSEGYVYLVSYYDDVNEARAGTVNNDSRVKVEASVLDEYEGESGVLKICGYQATNSNPINICVGIALPKTYTNGYTIRWRVEENDSTKACIRYLSLDDGFRYNATSFFLYGGKETQWGGLTTVTDNRYNNWHTEYYNMQNNDTTKDKLGFVFSTLNQGGWTLYLSYVMDGDTTNA